MTETIGSLIAARDGALAAIGAPGREWMSYGELRALGQRTGAALHRFGIGTADRVAIVLPNGPEAATAFVTIAQAAVTAPLNPAYSRAEFAFYLTDLKARAIVVAEGYDGPAVDLATELGLIILRLTPLAGAAGSFALTGPDAAMPAACPAPGAGDTALILHTSGTTSRPKIVPLSHANIVASAGNIRQSLALAPGDRCLNVMPLFHIHGLVAAVMATLAAGGSVSCAPGFDALRFFGWMKEVAPSWYTAVPTMHQAILARAARNPDIVARSRLRFIRSSSAALPAQVMTAMTALFGVPVIEAYGMTEAAHQMTSNPLHPGTQRPGQVGPAAGPLVRIAHEAENRLIGGLGEVVISGPNVTAGYEGNEDANARGFFLAAGIRWFRTGDQGVFDPDGHLRLTGRLKEIINRGGEKISPLEIDGILMDHPAVAQATAFALPHPSLGEDIAAAVVLHENATATEAELRAFAATRLAAFKVPRRLIVLPEIPKGATGKVQRIGLAERLGLTDTEPA